MVNLPYSRRRHRTSTGASAWFEQQQRQNRTARRLHATNVNWGCDSNNGMFGDIELVDDEGTVYKTERFPIPVGIDLQEITSFSQSDGDIVMRMNNGDSFVVSIQSIETPPAPGYNAWGTSALTTAQSQLYYSGAQGIMLDEGDEWASEPKKKTIKLPKNMKCTFCNKHIHYPEKLVELLGEKGTKDYLKYCKKSKTKPQLFCCGCYGFIQDKPKIYGALNKLNKQLEKFVKINEKEKELKVREKELDKELNKIRKKKS